MPCPGPRYCVLPAEPGDVVHSWLIARKLELFKDFQLVLDLCVCPRRLLRCALAVPGAFHYHMPQPAVLRVAAMNIEQRQLRRDQRKSERALLA